MIYLDYTANAPVEPRVLEAFCEAEGRFIGNANAKLLEIPYTLFESDIFEIANSQERNPCFLCAKMRRGCLYGKARELGCNKIALGHHFNDVIETTVMGMLWGGQLQGMILTLVDNTFMTPYLQRPLELGADIVIHSATKYLGGHSDLVAGLVVVKDDVVAGRLAFLQNATGGVLGPFDSFLLIRGIKTLAVRMDRHVENAERIAAWLAGNEAVARVYYPGLPDDPGYAVNRCQAKNGGAMISFTLTDAYDFRAFFKSLKFIMLAESLGGVESLVCHPSTMTHASIPRDLRLKVGITDNLIRLSPGIEAVEDLITDLDQAIAGSAR